MEKQNMVHSGHMINKME